MGGMAFANALLDLPTDRLRRIVHIVSKRELRR